MIESLLHTYRTRVVRAGVTVSLAVTLAGCGFLDPTDVDNPSTTDDDLAAAENPTQSLLPGLRALFANAVSATTVLTEVVSDNYSIHGTGLNDIYDDPRSIIPDDVNSTGGRTGSYWNLQELRALANFVLDDIVPNDATAEPDDVQEAQYYRGMALLMLAENYSGAPLEPDGALVAPAGLLAQAVADLEAARGGTFDLPSVAALARAHRLLGNTTEAGTFANQLLGADPTFLFQQLYDVNSIDNEPFNLLVDRALKEMQPLPRLDFLDPKYTTFEAGIAVAKAEEMHLILAEIAFSQNDFATGREQVALAIEVAQSRPTQNFDDNDERRNADLSFRPRTSDIVIASEPGAPFIAGLVLDRPGTLTTPTVAGASLDADADVRALDAATEQEEILRAFYLTRQEVLLLEGRRMSDLGIRLPIMLREIESNPTINLSDPAASVFVPAYIPAGSELDLFDPASPYDADGVLIGLPEITIRFDLNRILAQNHSAITPF